LKILVGKTFGIGNSVLAIPMIKALATLGEVDVLVGTTDDDFGAREVMNHLRPIVRDVHYDIAPHDYDVAIMAIPFDGRWRNGVDYGAKRVIDGRKRPGNVTRLGFDMWEKHEVEYQMENARELGYSGPTPDCSFMPRAASTIEDRVYLGIGYKRDPGGFGLSKHYGNDRYVRLMKTIRELRPGTEFLSTGGSADLIQTGVPLIRDTQNDGSYRFQSKPLRESFAELAFCKAYIGNDTGMMHVAASMGLPTCGLFAYPDLVTKNPPFCERSMSIVFGGNFPPVEWVVGEFVEFVWGAK
jgi:heptosyltransferase-2